MKLAELCAGYGGIGLAVGGELAWYAEIDGAASRVMAAHHPGISNLGDITAVDWRDAEPVEVLAAGYPCTDLSNAGKRTGIEGPNSGIWRNVADAVRVLRPRLVLLENVAAHLARGFGRVLGDLAEIGYDAWWTCLRASDVGAPHRRDRVFVVAAPVDPDREPVRLEPVPVGTRLGASVASGDSAGVLMPTPTANLGRGAGAPSVATATDRMASGRRFLDDAVALLPTPAARVSGRGSGWGDQPGRPLSETVHRLLPTPRASDSDSDKSGPNQRGSAGDLALAAAVALLPTPTAKDSQGGPRQIVPRTHDGTDFGPCLRDVVAYDRWGNYAAAIERWGRLLGRPAPDPTVPPTRRGAKPQLSAAFVEWLMGLPLGYVTGHVSRKAALRILGNGVVPQQGRAAYRSLLTGWEEPRA